jgi:hypothetical protein
MSLDAGGHYYQSLLIIVETQGERYPPLRYGGRLPVMEASLSFFALEVVSIARKGYVGMALG